jgi:hypothetical protein
LCVSATAAGFETNCGVNEVKPGGNITVTCKYSFNVSNWEDKKDLDIEFLAPGANATQCK